MWHFISDQISETVNQTFICETAKFIHQQHQHSCFVLRGNNKRYFVKLRESNYESDDSSLNRQMPPTPLQCEADGLAAITTLGCIKTPKVICYGTLIENHKSIEYLVMQYMCFKPPSEALWKMAGEQLANMHKHSIEDLASNTQYSFGWPHYNWLGSRIQHNAITDDWASFYCEQRLAPLITALMAKKIEVKLTEFDLIHIHQYLLNYRPTCSLLHGDLWSGNLGFTVDSPVVFDPAIYIGDREMDLAMARLFGGFAKSFFEAYSNVYPLMEDSQLRLPLYQLYPVLNHALMFGGSYTQQANQLIDKIRLNMFEV